MRVGFDKLDPRILPEMGVKVAFRDTAAAAPVNAHVVVIPKNALRQQDGRDVVLVLLNGKAERRAVTVSSTLGDETVISAGLVAGEKVIVDSPAGLSDGVPVKEKKL